jgi:hypothetical protein
MATQVLNTRLVRDAGLVVTKALPNNTNNTSDAIDIGSGPFNPEEIVVEVSVPAIAAHTTANNLQIQLYHGDASNSLAVTTPLVEVDVLGVVSTGSVALIKRFKLPPGTKRYIAFHNIATTDDCSAVTATYSLLL